MVSYDRPYALGDGSGDFLGNEFHVVSLVESLGLDVTYSTDVDGEVSAARMRSVRAVIIPGHSEYWTKNMYDGVTSARDAGVSLGLRKTAAVTVVVAAPDYPERSDHAGAPIGGLEAAEAAGALVFHGGTAIRDGQLVTNGGRILSVSGTGATVSEARSQAYAVLNFSPLRSATYTSRATSRTSRSASVCGGARGRACFSDR